MPPLIRPAIPAALGLLLTMTVLGAERVFTPADIIDWKRHSFEGETTYELVEIDGREAIHARCTDGTASGLFLEDSIDLNKTPIVEWEWRVDETFSGIDETVRAGDDYPARLYAVDEHSVLRWRTRALNYVWASEMEQGADWENAYASQARMIALQSGPPEESGQWVTERRNLRDDFRTYHDRDLDTIDALAIMTDCDDVGEPIEAWYGEIRLLPE
ncbi:DUF3047 domain-containing protein [Aquisalimonas asiatica]|uniref:DUF3047 domain-containing protein n=1 Tax=Aquisalimonas asiatica TaxID=406100 RepID=A0A1H8SKS3_9GAMM|nr:DUF3047 domain-containing protein [Aquisalimonas asiatica]SEO79165.1 Protein of unknown function [Aquisalimonas asiatica]